MHPIDQISILVPYFLIPRHISGARYGIAVIRRVSCYIGGGRPDTQDDRRLAEPKSLILGVRS